MDIPLEPTENDARQMVERFVRRFDASYRLLACHAALPLVLTPELVHYLRNTFLRGQVAWVAEADLLLSEICRPVGYEQYAMDTAVRAYLLAELRERAGPQRMQAVARLLLGYVRHLHQAGSRFSDHELQAQQLAAMVCLDDQRDQAVRELAEALRQNMTAAADHPQSTGNRAELARLARLTQTLAPQLATHPELVAYAALVGRMVADPARTMAAEGEQLQQPQQVLGRELPAVGVLRDRQQPEPAPASDHTAAGSRHPLLPEMIEIPAGPFLMGSSDDDEQADSDEKPQHRLELPTYWIGKTPVTNAQFRPFVAGDGYTNRDYWTAAGWQWREQEKIIRPRYWDDTQWNGDDYPVVGISWYEAVAYCRWLSAQTGHDLRLPTEAEWEKAARGPEGRIWPWGNTWEAGRCNSREAGEQRTTPVGSYPDGAGPYGVLDMAGNVWEWCATTWRKRYPYQVEDEWTDAYLAGNNGRVRRGGSWISGQKFVRGAIRNYGDFPHNRKDLFNGLRLAGHSPFSAAES